MRVVEVTRFGGPEVLHPAERPEPEAAPGQVVVRIRAANINPTDLGARSGHFPPGRDQEPPYVLGWDLAGEIAATGEGVSEFQAGDRVVGMIHWYDEEARLGAYAEAVAVEADWVVPLPDGLEYDAACTIPLNALTAAQGLELLALPPVSTLLVTGASGGVGSFAVQLAMVEGHRVIAQAGRDDEAWLHELGVAEVLPRDVDLATVPPVPAVFDAVPLGEPAVVPLEDGGAIVATRKTPDADPARGLRQHWFLIHPDLAKLEELVAAVAAGRLRTRVDRVLPLAEAAEAHRLVEAGGLHGKVVLAP
jgi:NADPH:quinone reductase-like Zn-dependent oxidoreductase